MSENTVVDVMLTEFNAIRAEVVQRISAQSLLVGVTAVGMTSLLLVSQDSLGRIPLVILVAGAASALSLLHLHQAFFIEKFSKYIREIWWPALRSNLDSTEESLPAWEEWSQRAIFHRPWQVGTMILTHGALALVLVASVVAAFVKQRADPFGSDAWGAYALLLPAVLVNIVFLAASWRDRRDRTDRAPQGTGVSSRVSDVRREGINPTNLASAPVQVLGAPGPQPVEVVAIPD